MLKPSLFAALRCLCCLTLSLQLPPDAGAAAHVSCVPPEVSLLHARQLLGSLPVLLLQASAHRRLFIISLCGSGPSGDSAD